MLKKGVRSPRWGLLDRVVNGSSEHGVKITLLCFWAEKEKFGSCKSGN